MTALWIDFKELRQKLDFAQVLRHYGVEVKLKRQGRQHQGFCPLPSHQGKKRSPSFSADLKRGIWRCFGCSEGGDILRFAALMQGLDPDRGEDIRTAALTLTESLGIETDSPRIRANGKHRKVQSRNQLPESEDHAGAEKNVEQAATCPTLVNAPLNFELQGLDPSHAYLKERGLTSETIAYFGLGYCSRGLMQERIAIPLHDERGLLVGYAGRLVDDNRIDEDHPKYRFPSAREREGKRYEFRKSLLLYHHFQIAGRTEDLIVVEGFPSVWWLWQQGYPNVVGLMGSDCSEEQAKLILAKVEIDGRIWFMSDGDEAGVRCAHSMFEQLSPYRFAKWVKLKNGQQPTDCTSEDFQAMLSI
jgi:DNA primase